MGMNPDLLIVGAGIAGGALATVMARRGAQVVLIDREREPRDRIRGEWMTPWGVAEVQRLDLLEPLHEAGANYSDKFIGYSDETSPAEAERKSIDFCRMVPGVQGALNIGHPAACRTLASLAEKAGATVITGISGLKILPGSSPCVRFQIDGKEQLFQPRLVIGADGRGSAVARQAAIKFMGEKATHLLGGLLVEGVPDWPEKVHSVGLLKGRRYYIFPQGAGRLRLYLTAVLGKRRDIAGDEDVRTFLENFRSTYLPNGASIAEAQQAGPLSFYPNADRWSEQPVADGVVLIGDAAGHNDPTIGQGLSITMRDARIVSGILSSTHDWSVASFAPYVAERSELMRRLRVVARMTSILQLSPPEADAGRRKRGADAIRHDRNFAPMFKATVVGPDKISSNAFGESAISRLLNA